MVASTKPTSSSLASPNRKETVAFATLIIVLLIISVVTTITNVVIIYKLRLIPGFEFFNFIDNHVIFNKDAYIEKILLAKNKISHLSTITGDICLDSGSSSFRLNKNGIQIAAERGFEVRNPQTGQLLYPFDFRSTPLTSIKTLSVPSGLRDVKMIRSPVDENLQIMSKNRIRIRGNEGVTIEGKHVKLDASSIFLSSINSSIILDGQQGVYLNMDSFASRIVHPHNTTNMKMQFKLCVCGKNGRLFRIPVKDQSTSCADVRFPQSENPCL